ncbi:MAG: AMP-binding protein, partial [Saprospiraceae bacterium]
LYFLKLKGLDFQWYQHWRKALGGRIESIITGSDGLSPSLARLYSAAGIDIREGYGMAETAPVISMNRLEATQVNFGTVGMPLNNVEVEISEPKDEFGNGEILVKGDNVMMGYWNREMPETKENEWLKTGDIGRFTDKKGFLQIAGRKEDIITLIDGTQVHPLFLENQIRNSLFISQCMVIGKDKPYLSALIVPSFTLLELWAKKENIEWTNKEEILLRDQIKELFREEIQQINQNLSPKEQITQFRLLPRKWFFEKGELSATLKKKRNRILKHFSSLIQEMYHTEN